MEQQKRTVEQSRHRVGDFVMTGTGWLKKVAKDKYVPWDGRRVFGK